MAEVNFPVGNLAKTHEMSTCLPVNTIKLSNQNSHIGTSKGLKVLVNIRYYDVSMLPNNCQPKH